MIGEHSTYPLFSFSLFIFLQAYALACKGADHINCFHEVKRELIINQQPAWGRSREFEITTRSSGRNGLSETTTGDVEDVEDDDDDEGLVNGRRKRKVAFLPSLGEC